jgi:transposase
MKVSTIGLDIAKQVFQVHGADKKGRAVFRRKLKCNEVGRLFSRLEPCVVGIEASGSAHSWVRVLGGLGHTVRLMAPPFVKPYVKSQKNDANDAEAICEAVTRPNMRFVPQKSIEQQDIQCLHRVRS